MRQESILRLVALVSYGTKSLRKEIALEDWYQHGIFWDARLQFRRQADHAMLASDFTLWLAVLVRSGATRLSLHMFSQFEIPVPEALARVDHAVVVHYADRHEIWAVGQERAEWLAHPSLPTDPSAAYRVAPDAARYGGDIDNFWCVETRAGELQVPDTNWKALAAAIARDLDTNMPASDVRAGPYYGPVSEQCRTRMPLFPKSPDASLAYWILSSLDWKKGRFDNDMNPKNDNGAYAHASQDDLDILEGWGERLDCWFVEVLIRAANEARATNMFGREAPLVRIYTPATRAAGRAGESLRVGRQAPDALADQASSEQPPPASHTDQADAGADKPPFSWMRLIGWSIAAVMLGVIILAGARIVANHPWAAAVVGVAWALYLRYRKA